MNDLATLALIRKLPPQWRADAPRRIGAFVVHPASNELSGPAGTVRVRPRLMDVLLRLAAEPGTVIARSRLLEEVWPRRMVSDEVLSRTIAELRTALGDDPRHPSYIETIPTVGYRLVAVTGATIDPPATVLRATRAAVDAVSDGTGTVAVNPTGTTTGATDAKDSGVDRAAVPVRATRRPVRMPVIIAAAVAALALAAWASWQHAVEDAAPTLAARVANATPFLSDPGLEMEPRFSPDGSRIAFSSSTEFLSRSHIVVLDTGESDARMLVGGNDDGANYRSPVFVGGPTRLAYARCIDKRCAIIERDVASGTERVVVAEPRAPLPNFDVSADGRWLVYANLHRAKYPASLALVDLASGATRELSAPAANTGDDLLPRFSADGSQIAFFRGVGGLAELWTMARDGSGAAPASNARGAMYGAAWRDAQHILVAADWFGFRSLNEVDLATHVATFVGARGARFPDIAPNGEIVYENAQFRTDLWAFDPATRTLAEKPWWPSTRFTMKPEFSPDGRRVVFVSNREGAESLFVADGDAAPVRMKLPETYRYINAHWSPDGGSLYVVRLDATPPHTMSSVRVDVATGRVDRLDALGGDVEEMYVDASFLYFSKGMGQAMQLMRAPVDNLRNQEATPYPLISSFMVDHGMLAFTQPQIRGLTLCTLASGACEALPLPISDDIYGAWAIAAGAVWFLDASVSPPTLARYDIAERRVTLRHAAYPMAFGRSIAVSPDGNRVLLARGAPTLIDLMVAR